MDLQLDKTKFFNEVNVKMSIVLDNYCIKPEGHIEGSIILTPKFKGDNIILKDSKIVLTLTQYEFFDYSNSEKDAQNKQNEHNKKHKEIIFNKEAKIEIENNKISCTLKIPIKVSIPNNEKLLPSFNLKNKDFIAGVRHIFTVNIPDINAINSIGILISDILPKKGKDNPENIIYKNEQIYKMGIMHKGNISYCIRIPKNEYKHDEDISIKIMVDSSSLQENKIEKIKVKLQRKFVILGYTVNSDFRYALNEKIFEKSELSEKNSNKYELEYTFPKIQDNNFNEKEIEQFIHFNENIIDYNWNNKCLAPSMKGYFFSCEYKIKIRTILDSSLITTKKIDFPIDIYFSEEYFNRLKLDFEKEKEKDIKFGSFVLVKGKEEKNEDNNALDNKK